MNVEVNKLLADKYSIIRAHNYLKKMDKRKFKIEYFIREFLDIVKRLA